jgi:hypothetical protein
VLLRAPPCRPPSPPHPTGDGPAAAGRSYIELKNTMCGQGRIHVQVLRCFLCMYPITPL